MLIKTIDPSNGHWNAKHNKYFYLKKKKKQIVDIQKIPSLMQLSMWLLQRNAVIQQPSCNISQTEFFGV